MKDREIVVKALGAEYVEEIKAVQQVEAVAQKGACKKRVLTYQQNDAEKEHHATPNEL